MTVETNRFVAWISISVDSHELLLDFAAAQMTLRLQEFPQLVLLGRRLEVDMQSFGWYELSCGHQRISIVTEAAPSILAMSASNVTRESSTLPLTLFLPTIRQPAESSAVFPEWMRRPRK